MPKNLFNFGAYVRAHREIPWVIPEEPTITYLLSENIVIVASIATTEVK